jgi:hypothetical protein
MKAKKIVCQILNKSIRDLIDHNIWLQSLSKDEDEPLNKEEISYARRVVRENCVAIEDLQQLRSEYELKRSN